MLNGSFIVVAPAGMQPYLAVVHEPGRFPLRGVEIDGLCLVVQRDDGRGERFDFASSRYAGALLSQLGDGAHEGASSAAGEDAPEGLMLMSFDEIDAAELAQRPRDVAFVRAGLPVEQIHSREADAGSSQRQVRGPGMSG